MFAYVDAIYFTAEVTRLWVVSSSGGEPIPVTDGRTNDWNPTWSGDGRELFFVSNRGGSMDLWQQRIGGDGKPKGEAVPITAGGCARRRFLRTAPGSLTPEAVWCRTCGGFPSCGIGWPPRQTLCS